MLVSKSNGFNASAVLGSGSYNENKSSKHMELLAHSILKLICNCEFLVVIFEKLHKVLYETCVI